MPDPTIPLIQRAPDAVAEPHQREWLDDIKQQMAQLYKDGYADGLKAGKRLAEQEAAHDAEMKRLARELASLEAQLAPLPPPVPDEAWQETAEMNAVLSRPDRFEQE